LVEVESKKVVNKIISEIRHLANPSTDWRRESCYSFDAVGNRTSSHLEGGTSYSISSFNRLTSRTTMMPSATVSYTFDNNGNMTSKNDSSGKWYYNYDAENRLVRATKFGMGSFASRSVVYQYDALGRRVVRQDKKNGRTEFTLDGLDVIQDRKSNGEVVNYVNGLGIDDKLKVTSGTSSSYFLQDHLGSTVGMSDSQGNITESATYDSFGRVITSNLTTRYQYTRREYDEYTSLMFYRARFYDPQIGRFISEDPIEFDGGVNWYAYVKNNPILFRDPLGLQRCNPLVGSIVGGVIGGAIGVAAGTVAGPPIFGAIGGAIGSTVGSFALPGGGTIGGGVGGAAIGAAAGAVIGPVVGGVGGALLGSYIGEMICSGGEATTCDSTPKAVPIPFPTPNTIPLVPPIPMAPPAPSPTPPPKFKCTGQFIPGGNVTPSYCLYTCTSSAGKWTVRLPPKPGGNPCPDIQNF
jgi:RHS repeat-associated protein